MLGRRSDDIKDLLAARPIRERTLEDTLRKLKNKEKKEKRKVTSYRNKISMGQRRKVIIMWFGAVGNKEKLVYELTKE